MYRYLALRPPADTGTIRLLCFHHAGAGALTFAGWQRRVGTGVCVLPVRLPGRETRIREPHITRAPRLLEELQRDLGPLLDAPYAFYGHSMGALVAYRFAEWRHRAGLRPPERLLVGACPAPQSRSAVLGALRPELADEQLLGALDEENLPPQLLARPEWLRSTLATLRADLRLAHSLRSTPPTALTCPLDAFAGRDDPMTPKEEISPWEQCTAARFRMHDVAGAHFFVRGGELPPLVAAALTADARPHQAA